MLPDNRLRLQAPAIDFTNNVGITGQDHDNYPAPNQQARYDHLRMYLIALLANQSSYSAPTQYREGTLWFNLNTNELLIMHNGSWTSMLDVIKVGDITLNQTIAGLKSDALTNISLNIPAYSNDTQASAGGVQIGGLYHVNGVVRVRLI